MKIGIVTDSTTDQTDEDYKKHDIVMVPLTVRFGDEVMVDWKDAKPEEFYKRMRAAETLPQTSQPSAQAFADAYRSLAKTCDHIISIHITSKLSGTIHSAEAAATMVKNEIPVTCIDSEVISHLLWAVILRMDAARKAGRTLEQIVEITEAAKKRAKLFFTVDTMKYLEMGGRIGKAQAFLGQLLNVKPILTLTDGGTPTPKGKSRGSKASIREIVGFAKAEIDAIPADEEVTLITAHADSPEMLAYMEQLITEMGLRYTNRLSGWIGSVVGSHLGPGTMAIGVV